MMRVNFDKAEHPSPGQVHGQIRELKRWRRHRASKDLTCGTLDVTIAQLEKYHRLLNDAYINELNNNAPISPTLRSVS